MKNGNQKPSGTFLMQQTSFKPNGDFSSPADKNKLPKVFRNFARLSVLLPDYAASIETEYITTYFTDTENQIS